MPLAFAAVGLYGCVVVIGVRARRLGLVELAACAGIFIVAVGISILAVGTLWNVVRGLLDRNGVAWQKLDMPIMGGFAILTAASTLVLARWAGSRRSLTGLCVGAYSWWVLFSLAAAHWLTGASYLFVWPTLAGLAGLGVSILSRPGSVNAWVATCVCSIPSLVLLPPMIHAISGALSAAMTMPIVLFIVLRLPIVVLIVLFLGTMLQIVGPLIAPGPRREHASLDGTQP